MRKYVNKYRIVKKKKKKKKKRIPIAIHASTSGTRGLRRCHRKRRWHRSLHSFYLRPDNLRLSHHVGRTFRSDALRVISCRCIIVPTSSFSMSKNITKSCLFNFQSLEEFFKKIPNCCSSRSFLLSSKRFTLPSSRGRAGFSVVFVDLTL